MMFNCAILLAVSKVVSSELNSEKIDIFRSEGVTGVFLAVSVATRILKSWTPSKPSLTIKL